MNDSSFSGSDNDDRRISEMEFGDVEDGNEGRTVGDQDQIGEENSRTCQPVVDFILKICGEEKREVVQARLKNLGVNTLSDLEVLDLKDSFIDVLTPVEIGKLQRDFKQSMLLYNVMQYFLLFLKIILFICLLLQLVKMNAKTKKHQDLKLLISTKYLALTN